MGLLIFSSIFGHSVARLVNAIGGRKTRTRKTETGESQRVTNIFWRNTRLEKHHPEGDPLNTDPPSTPPSGPRDITCSACGCKIARSGEVLATGETYKKFLKHEQTIEGKDREIERLNAEITRLNGEITALKASTGQGRASGHVPGRKID